MAERPLGRDVTARQRFARLFSLGDRRAPLSWSPGLVLSPNDPELPISIAPLKSFRSSHSIPSTVTISTRSNLCYPFDSDDEWELNEGLVLPPSLVESDSGEFGSGVEAIPISWNSLHHDHSLSKLDSQPSLIVLTDAPQLSNNPRILERSILTIRRRFPASLIWAPGISGPDNCALLAWMGVDLFDLARSRQASSLGILLSESGPRKTEHTMSETSSMESQCESWARAISATRSAIRDGSLRELAERQSMASPRSVEHLRWHDKMAYEKAETHGILSSAVSMNRKLRCHSFESRNDPLIQDWRWRVAERHHPPEHQREVLVLLPCSARKPYKLSKSHMRFRRVIKSPNIHEVMITAPLGLVPRELEELWPAAHYDIPVTGDWDADELQIIRRMVGRIVERIGYSAVVNHSGIDIQVDGTRVIDTRRGDSAGSKEALARLESEVEAAVQIAGSVETTERPRMLVMKSISRFMLGSDEWLEGTEISGRPPILTISKGGIQLAKWDPRRGRFLFSKSSLPILGELEILSRVNLRDDVEWVGDIFPTSVKSFIGSIRTGDELLVYQKGELIGSARAVAPGWEWPHGPGRLARSRHRLKPMTQKAA